MVLFYYMNIFWKGQSCFYIIISRGREEQVGILVEPFDEKAGLRLSPTRVDILINSGHYKKNKAITGDYFLIEGAGEYEKKDVFVKGIFNKEEKNIIYTIEAEGINICHLGSVKRKELNAFQIEEIGNVDILMIPVGGGDTINGLQATNIIKQIEPKIVIPMQFDLPGLKNKLDSVGDFLKAVGKDVSEPLDKLSIKQKNLPEQELQVLVLRPR